MISLQRFFKMYDQLTKEEQKEFFAFFGFDIFDNKLICNKCRKPFTAQQDRDLHQFYCKGST